MSAAKITEVDREVARARAESIASRWVPAHMTARQGLVDNIAAELENYKQLGLERADAEHEAAQAALREEARTWQERSLAIQRQEDATDAQLEAANRLLREARLGLVDDCQVAGAIDAHLAQSAGTGGGAGASGDHERRLNAQRELIADHEARIAALEAAVKGLRFGNFDPPAPQPPEAPRPGEGHAFIPSVRWQWERDRGCVCQHKTGAVTVCGLFERDPIHATPGGREGAK